MKAVMNNIAAVFFAFIIIQFTSCTAGNTDEFKSSITASELAERFDAMLINGSKLSAVDDDYITGMIGLNLDDVTEYVLKIQTSGTEVDQYGIFKTTSEMKAETLAGSVKSYLETLSENWENFNYLPEEMPKINAAEVQSAGLYVIFVIATEDEKKAVFDEFYFMLKK